jgi:hypothetical protein
MLLEPKRLLIKEQLEMLLISMAILVLQLLPPLLRFQCGLKLMLMALMKAV